MPIVLKSGSLNHLEPSGPVQARNGVVLPVSKTHVYDRRVAGYTVSNTELTVVSNLVSVGD